MIDRELFLVQTAAALPATTITPVTLSRPQAATARTNTFDAVTEPIRDELRAGRAIVTLPATIAAASVTLTKLELVRYRDDYGTPAVTELFANGSTGTTTKTLFSGSILLNAASPRDDLLQNIYLSANERVVLTINNATGAPITGTIDVQYDFGREAGDYTLKS